MVAKSKKPAAAASVGGWERRGGSHGSCEPSGAVVNRLEQVFGLEALGTSPVHVCARSLEPGTSLALAQPATPRPETGNRGWASSVHGQACRPLCLAACSAGVYMTQHLLAMQFEMLLVWACNV